MSILHQGEVICRLHLITCYVILFQLLIKLMVVQNFKGAVEGYSLKRVDTTGAGDAFMGALLRKIVDDLSIIEVKFQFK